MFWVVNNMASQCHINVLLLLAISFFTNVNSSIRETKTHAGSKPHLVMVLQDDLGHHDVGFNNEQMSSLTPNIDNVAKSGIILTNHLVHFHCSPTRRSFITGRLPIHHGEMLSGVATDDVDLRWNLISDKMHSAGYECHWIGKGHTGYKSYHHLPTQRGFDSFTGFLAGSQSYTSTDRWQNLVPYNGSVYSSELFGMETINRIEQRDQTKPFFLYLPWQAVHSPYDDVPGWYCNSCDKFLPYPGVYAGMLNSSDYYFGQVIQVLLPFPLSLSSDFFRRNSNPQTCGTICSLCTPRITVGFLKMALLESTTLFVGKSTAIGMEGLELLLLYQAD
eukprot:m.38237 g.38237  ORF g.38237 m.38237 type:complete len:333 (+) comp9412_c0_seq1:2-1000(+)